MAACIICGNIKSVVEFASVIVHDVTRDFPVCELWEWFMEFEQWQAV